MNTAIYSPSGSSAGIGFAVPVDTVNRVVPQLIRTGVYRPPLLGVVHDERINALAREQGIEGVLVLDVEPGSPAAAAGLRPAMQDRQGMIVPGDLVVGVGDAARRDVARAARGARPACAGGCGGRCRRLRDGREVRVPVVLDAPPRAWPSSTARRQPCAYSGRWTYSLIVWISYWPAPMVTVGTPCRSSQLASSPPFEKTKVGSSPMAFTAFAAWATAGLSLARLKGG